MALVQGKVAGLIETPIIEMQFPDKQTADGIRSYFSSITPLGRVGRPEEVAAAALFHASDQSSYITGIDLPVDGGIVAVKALRHPLTVANRECETGG